MIDIVAVGNKYDDDDVDVHRSLLNVCRVKIMLYTRFQEMGYFAGECSPLLG